MKHTKTITVDQLKPGMFIVGMDQPWYRTPFLFHKRLIRHMEDIDLLRRHGIRALEIDPSRGFDVEQVLSEDAPMSSNTREQTATPETSLQPASIAEINIAQPQSPRTHQDTSSPSNAGDQAAAAQLSHAARPTPPDKPPQPDHRTEINAARPQSPDTQQDAPTPSSTREQTAITQSSHAAQPATPEISRQPASIAEMNITQPQAPSPHQDPPSPSNAGKQAAAAQETYSEAISSMERMFDELEAGIVPQPGTLQKVVANVLSRVLDDGATMLSLLSFQKMKRFDRTLASHALDVCTLSLIVAHDYGVAEEDLEALGAGALLHDIGYVRLPRNLYRRSHDLTEQERTIMQQHAALGLAMLQEAKEDRNAIVRIVAEHHECSNGSGFPHKLTGDSISPLAQLVGLVDMYDGMVSRRGGRPAMLPHDAIRQLFRLGDTGQYAKDLIQAMIGSLGVYPIGSLVLMNTGEQAVVVGMNRTHRLKPVIKVITGPQGGSYLTPIRIDLGTQAVGPSARVIKKVLSPLDERVNVAMFLDGIHEEAA